MFNCLLLFFVPLNCFLLFFILLNCVLLLFCPVKLFVTVLCPVELLVAVFLSCRIVSYWYSGLFPLIFNQMFPMLNLINLYLTTVYAFQRNLLYEKSQL